MGFVAFSWSRLSSDVCYDTCPAWGALPLRPSPSRLGALERSSAWNRAVRAVSAGGTQTAVGSA